MIINNEAIATKIFEYLNHIISLAKLVNWCENLLLSDDVIFDNNEIAMEISTKIGLADTENFMITWEEWTYILEKLSFKATIQSVHLAA